MTAGRPDKLTEARHDYIMELYRKGATNSMAADMSGVCEKTIYRWVEQGKADEEVGLDSKFVKFLHGYKKERGSYDFQALDSIKLASETQWQAAAWLLERRRSKDFGRNVVEREVIKIDPTDREKFINQIIEMVADKIITVSEGLALAKIKLDSDNTEYKTELLDRVKALEAE